MDHEEEFTDIADDEVDELVAEYIQAKARKIELVRTDATHWTMVATVPD